MKQTQTVAFALALTLVLIGSVSWAATRLDSSRNMQKKLPETAATNLNSSRSNIYRVKVTKVNPNDKTFEVQVTFSAKQMATLPAVGDVVDVTYTQDPGGSLQAINLNSSKSN